MDESLAPGIEIVATPIGDAPVKVRRAWIGLTLPLHESSLVGPMTLPGVSVLAASTGWRSWLGWLLRRPYPVMEYTCYIVPSAAAIGILAEAAPDAANWWRQNVPAFLQADATFVFDAACCRPVNLHISTDSRETPP